MHGEREKDRKCKRNHLHAKSPVAVHLHRLRGEQKEPRDQHHHEASEHPRLDFPGKFANTISLKSNAEEAEINDQNCPTQHAQRQEMEYLDERKQPYRAAYPVPEKRVVGPFTE